MTSLQVRIFASTFALQRRDKYLLNVFLQEWNPCVFQALIHSDMVRHLVEAFLADADLPQMHRDAD